MPRREYKLTLPCTSGTGCRDSLTYRYDTQREYADSARHYRDHPWKCSRHANPAGWLRPGNEEATGIMTAVRVPVRDRGPDGKFRDVPGKFLDGLFWHLEGKSAGSSLCHGPGFFADARDFPEGTRLVVTARIITPEEAPDD